MAKIKNITAGPKGVYASDGSLVMIVAGTTETIDMTDGEIASAKGTGHFEIDGDDAPEPGPLDQSVERLTTYLETVTDADEVQKLIDAETAGKSRTGAITALEARLAALLA